MKRAFTHFITVLFLGFLLIGAICIVQNLIEDINKMFFPEHNQKHLLAYHE